MTHSKFNLLTTLNLNCDDQRWREYIYCISQNLQNKLINSIYIAVEMNIKNKKQRERCKYIKSLKRTYIHEIKSRPTFEELFKLCNQTKGKWIISNADIYFPKTNTDKLSLLLEKDYNKECFVLTRYNILKEMKEKKPGIDILYDNIRLRTMHKNFREGSSIDSWIFESPFDFSKVNLDIQLGQPQCDGMMNYQLSKIRKVTNPCLSVISIHKHKGWYEWYRNVKFNGESMNGRQYNILMEEKGHKATKIKFTHLPGND